jgi:hypothetical protein
MYHKVSYIPILYKRYSKVRAWYSPIQWLETHCWWWCFFAFRKKGSPSMSIPTKQHCITPYPALNIRKLTTFYLTHILTFYLTFCHVLSGIRSGINSDILSGIYSDVLSDIYSTLTLYLALYLTDVLTFLLTSILTVYQTCGISSDKCSDILSEIFRHAGSKIDILCAGVAGPRKSASSH